MPPRPRATPNEKPGTLKVVPLVPAPPRERKPGRPKKRPMPPLPAFNFNELEQEWFDWVIDAYLDEYPDLTDTDKMQLPLIAIQFIEYFRVAAKELQEGEVISMARQHPFTNLKGLMENLSVTRKARKQDKSPAEDEKTSAQKRLMELLG